MLLFRRHASCYELMGSEWFRLQLRGYNLLPLHVDKQTLMLATIQETLLCVSIAIMKSTRAISHEAHLFRVMPATRAVRIRLRPYSESQTG